MLQPRRPGHSTALALLVISCLALSFYGFAVGPGPIGPLPRVPEPRIAGLVTLSDATPPGRATLTTDTEPGVDEETGAAREETGVADDDADTAGRVRDLVEPR